MGWFIFNDLGKQEDYEAKRLKSVKMLAGLIGVVTAQISFGRSSVSVRVRSCPFVSGHVFLIEPQWDAGILI
jgi:hypothetical protein